MKRPREIKLSREDGEALIERLERNALSANDRHILVQLIRLYFWLVFTLQETRISLKRLRTLLFGQKSKPRKQPPSAPSSGVTGDPHGNGDASSSSDGVQPPSDHGRNSGESRRPGHGRQSSQAYSGACLEVCHHDALAVGQRCPLCGRGRLYELPKGVELRIDGGALLSAVRYELERLRCSACGGVFRARLPDDVSQEKYSYRSRAVLALSRYFLGVPFYRLESYQAMLGVPVADATQWDQVERVADCAYPVFEHLKHLAAQGEVIYQDDTHVRILSVMADNVKAQAAESSAGASRERTGMHTTALVSKRDEQTICLYMSGRAHAGENLQGLLSQRLPEHDKPIVMSDALSANQADEEALIRSHCLAHARRKFTELEDLFPEACADVTQALNQVFEHEDKARAWQLSAEARLAYHQHRSGPVMAALKTWLETQFEGREVEPNSSLGKACRYMLKHWSTLNRFLQVAGAPIDNNTAERALKLPIRQRKNSLFYASEHSAYVASLLSSLIATCVEAGVNALDYLVSLQGHRASVLRQPEMWLPWNYHLRLLRA